MEVLLYTFYNPMFLKWVVVLFLCCSYSNMSYIVDQMFPPPPEDTSEDFSNFIYWRDPIPDLVVDAHLHAAETAIVIEETRKKSTSSMAVA
jgi:phosphatidate phosphatase LPIN